MLSHIKGQEKKEIIFPKKRSQLEVETAVGTVVEPDATEKSTNNLVETSREAKRDAQAPVLVSVERVRCDPDQDIHRREHKQVQQASRGK